MLGLESYDHKVGYPKKGGYGMSLKANTNDPKQVWDVVPLCNTKTLQAIDTEPRNPSQHAAMEVFCMDYQERHQAKQVNSRQHWLLPALCNSFLVMTGFLITKVIQYVRPEKELHRSLQASEVCLLGLLVSELQVHQEEGRHYLRKAAKESVSRTSLSGG